MEVKCFGTLNESKDQKYIKKYRRAWLNSSFHFNKYLNTTLDHF